MSTPTHASTVRQFFSRHGALSKWHPSYEYRPGQLEMAEAVESALADRTQLPQNQQASLDVFVEIG